MEYLIIVFIILMVIGVLYSDPNDPSQFWEAKDPENPNILTYDPNHPFNKKLKDLTLIELKRVLDKDV